MPLAERLADCQEDDEVTVFSRTEFRTPRFVAITGAVSRSGRFPWREGMTLRDLVLQAGGLSEGAAVDFAEIARQPVVRAEGELARTERVAIDSSYLFDEGRRRGTAPEVALQPYDNVLLFRRPDWEAPRVVSITGEVKYPGNYTLRSKAETIKDLVQRAGGLTKDANANATDNLLLEAGDALTIPPRRQTLEIRGEVNSPTVTAIVRDQKLGYYVRTGGGPTKNASTRRAYMLQPNGKMETRRRLFWLMDLDPTPRAGATVVVPMRDTTATLNSAFASVSMFAQLIASLAAVWAISKK